MNSNRKLWIGLGTLLVLSFSVLLWVGTEIHRVMPPIPAKVVSASGEVLYTRADIEKPRPRRAGRRRALRCNWDRETRCSRRMHRTFRSAAFC